MRGWNPPLFTKSTTSDWYVLSRKRLFSRYGTENRPHPKPFTNLAIPTGPDDTIIDWCEPLDPSYRIQL